MSSLIAPLVFDCWTFSEGFLFLGDKRSAPTSCGTVDRTVKQYSEGISPSLMKIIETSFSGEVNKDVHHYTDEFMKYRFIKEKEYSTIYLAQMDYKIKPSKDNQYCAVYSNSGIHCDFYQQIPSPEGDFLKVSRGVYLFTLVRDTHYPSEWIVEFILHPETKTQLILFGSRHTLEFYNTTGVSHSKVKGYEHIYFKRIKWIDETSFLLHAWEWQPCDQVLICDLSKFFADPEKYSMDMIWFEDDWKTYPSVKDGKVCMEGDDTDEESD
ncbi:MAG: hypothetical protein PHG66_00740 [Candidatus Colwellbacteria bacterium]|nr:hypothetical protein [Candidatus Colwellbacteria bacterium]